MRPENEQIKHYLEQLELGTSYMERTQHKVLFEDAVRDNHISLPHIGIRHVMGPPGGANKVREITDILGTTFYESRPEIRTIYGEYPEYREEWKDHLIKLVRVTEDHSVSYIELKLTLTQYIDRISHMRSLPLTELPPMLTTGEDYMKPFIIKRLKGK